MKPIVIIYLFYCACLSCKGQTEFGADYLSLQKEISLPDVKGRLDHIAINEKDQIVYLAALGNNTLEVIDLNKGRVIHEIGNLDEPQGVAYIPQTNEIFVANGGNGNCYFFNAADYRKVAEIHLSSDADDVQTDLTTGKIYVGYGDGGVAVINSADHKKIADIKLPGHPESFQVDKKGEWLWVNLPGSGMVGVVNLVSQKLTDQWEKTLPRFNFPMAYDEARHALIVGYRLPSKMIIFDTLTGKTLSEQKIVSDADDLFYNEQNQHIYISGGGGSINIFKLSDNLWKQVANIPTSSGARTSLLVADLKLFLVAKRETSASPAQLLVYKLLK